LSHPLIHTDHLLLGLLQVESEAPSKVAVLLEAGFALDEAREIVRHEWRDEA